MKSNEYEVIIIGGSYAGLSAAMSLGRASRRTLVIDAGRPCNRQTPHSHNFLTRDGETPAAIAATAREQVLRYPAIRFENDTVAGILKSGNNFTLKTESGATYIAKKILLATGVYDIMPNIKGFAECWGISIIHCPYCHGYEVKGEKTAVLANGDMAYHYAALLQQWTKHLTILTNGKADFTPEQTEKLEKYNITIIETSIVEIVHNEGQLKSIITTDGNKHEFSAMYSRPEFKQHIPIAEQLNLLNDMGYIATDEMQRTNTAGIYAAGDCTSPMRAVASAVASGNMAGAAINNDMAMETF